MPSARPVVGPSNPETKSVVIEALTYLLALSGGLAVCHLACSMRSRFPHSAFLVLGSLVSLVAGLASLHGVLTAQLSRSVRTVLWWPIFGLGFLVVGLLASLAWLLLVRGGARLFDRFRNR